MPETVVPTGAVGVIVIEIASVAPAATRSGLNGVPAVERLDGVGHRRADRWVERPRSWPIDRRGLGPVGSPDLGYGPTPSWNTFHSPALTPSGGA